MDDLQQLKSRVEAARLQLHRTAEENRRYRSQLQDIAAILEGSIGAQKAKLGELREQLAAIAVESQRLRNENESARKGLIQAREIANSLQARVNQREDQNEILRRLLLELLNAIERDQGPTFTEMLGRIETGARLLANRGQETRNPADIAANGEHAPPENEPEAINDVALIDAHSIVTEIEGDRPEAESSAEEEARGDDPSLREIAG